MHGFRNRAWVAAGVVLLGSLAARGQVKTDGSLGARQTLAGPNFAIPASLGQTRGGNLFHSFSQFDIPEGGSATFSGPGSIHNVLARVTGGKASQINGRLACDIEGANVYLINPAGVVFGASGTLDVKGSFCATTADSVVLKDGTKFEVGTKGGGVLTSAPPTAFGFLQKATRPAIRLEGGVLQVPDGRALSFVGNRIAITGGTMQAADGRVNLVAPAAGATATFDPSSLDGAVVVDRSKGRGPITVSGSSLIDVSGAGGGRVSVNGGDVSVTGGAELLRQSSGNGRGIDVDVNALHVLSGGSIESDSNSAGTGGAVTIRARGAVEVDDQASGLVTGITTHALDVGRGGDMSITAGSVRVAGEGGVIAAGATAQGDAGRLTIVADSIAVLGGGGITGSSFGEGNAAEVDIRVSGDVTLDGQGSPVTGISSLGGGLGSPAGNGGTINVTARSMTIAHDATVDGSTSGAGTGGSIHLNVARTLLIEGALDNQLTGILSDSLSSEATAGRGGNITVSARSLELRSSGQISSSTDGVGTGGHINLTVRDELRIDGTDSSNLPTGIFSQTQGDGRAGDIAIRAGAMTILQGGLVDDSTFASGDAGEIKLTVTGALTARSGGIFSNNADAGASGRGGRLTVRAATIELSDGGEIDAGTKGSGEAGEMMVSADSIRLTKRGMIRARTTGAGNAGRLTVSADEGVTIDGGGTISSDSAADGATGAGGDVTVNAKTIDVGARGTISATSGAARAGKIVLNAQTLTLHDGGSVSVRSLADTAGDIVVNASRSVSLSDERPNAPAAVESLTLEPPVNTRISAEAVAGNGGNITINTPGEVILRNSLVTARAAGMGAAITIDPPVVVLQDSVINGTASGRGVRVTIDPAAQVINSGSIIVSNNQSVPSPIDLAGILTPFSLDLAEKGVVLAEECPQISGAAEISSFLILGRGGTPVGTGGLAPSFDLSNGGDGRRERR